MSTKIYDGEPLKAVSTSPQRPQHQINRSASELSSPIKLPRHHPLHQRRERDRDDRASLSANPAIPLPRDSLDLPRSEGVTPGATTDTSRRLDMFLPGAEDAGNHAGVPMAHQPSRSKEEQIKGRGRKPASSTTGLQNSLADLSAFSNTTMRRLDDTYYSVLERLSMLQSTIVAIKELASMSQEVSESFGEESKGLVSEIESQMGSFDQFDDQQKRIQVLQDRIYAGRDKAQTLSKRVDVVRERIEGWERADREWQERTRKRLKVLWIFISAILFVMMLVFFGARFAPSSADVSVVTELRGSSSQDGLPLADGFIGNESESAAGMTDEVREVLSQRKDDNLAEEGVLRAFDEL
ncbi:hypothetical protein F5X96DRAFT_149054 [Biscogniauxia mediterranea]|nr:hypothetical protein F5X96DRAFT_149054 [Biscogniauxia mediterranea]